jgi:hypothetical protein
MDIENLPDANAEPETTGLLSKRSREEIKNATA